MYNNTMANKNRNRRIWVLMLLCLGVLQQCALYKGEKGPKIIIHLERDNLVDSSLLVLNFAEPHYARGKGVAVAEMVHEILLESKKFKVVTLDTSSFWSFIGDSEEDTLLEALKYPRAKEFDYVLLGELTDYYFGGLHPTRVYMKIRIMEVKTKTTIFMAAHGLQSKGKDPNYPMQTQLTQQSPNPINLADEIFRQIIKKL